LKTKGLRSQQIDWLVWKFTTIVARCYIQTAKMKKLGSIKNKVVKHLEKVNIKKVILILHTHVTHGIDVLNETGHAWMVQNQQHPNMTYEVSFPFIKYVCYTCEWMLRRNLCKHQVVLIFTCTNFTKDNNIQYCGTWYGFNGGGFVAMFMDPTYLHIYDNESNDEKANKNHSEEPWVCDTR
jgi:hypothetical protein